MMMRSPYLELKIDLDALAAAWYWDNVTTAAVLPMGVRTGKKI
jgi:hypothetical protein